MQELRDRRVLVTGASGFVGRHLVEALRQAGANVHFFSRNPVQGLPVPGYRIGDIRDAKFVTNTIAEVDPEFIFHLCAYKNRHAGWDHFAPAIETNLAGTLNLLAAAGSLRGLASIIVLGTAEEYGDNNAPFEEGMRERPVSAYSLSKLCQTQLCQTLNRLHRLPVTVLRPTIAYGPGQAEDMFLPALINTLMRDEPFEMTAGMQTRDFVYVSDLAEVMIKAALLPSGSGEIFNVGSGTPVAIAQLALKVENMIGKSGLVRLGALEYRIGEIMDYYVSTKKTNDLLGWAPRVSLEQGLADTIAYYRNRS